MATANKERFLDALSNSVHASGRLADHIAFISCVNKPRHVRLSLLDHSSRRDLRNARNARSCSCCTWTRRLDRRHALFERTKDHARGGNSRLNTCRRVVSLANNELGVSAQLASAGKTHDHSCRWNVSTMDERDLERVSSTFPRGRFSLFAVSVDVARS